MSYCSSGHNNPTNGSAERPNNHRTVVLYGIQVYIIVVPILNLGITMESFNVLVAGSKAYGTDKGSETRQHPPGIV